MEPIILVRLTSTQKQRPTPLSHKLVKVGQTIHPESHRSAPGHVQGDTLGMQAELWAGSGVTRVPTKPRYRM